MGSRWRSAWLFKERAHFKNRVVRRGSHFSHVESSADKDNTEFGSSHVRYEYETVVVLWHNMLTGFSLTICIEINKYKLNFVNIIWLLCYYCIG